MNDSIHINYMSKIYNSYARDAIRRAETQKNMSCVEKTSFSDAVLEAAGSTREKKSGYIQESLQKHPDWRPTVEKHIASGEKVKEAFPLSKTTEEMTMAEYKSYIADLIDSIPVDPTHAKDDMCINISEEGWETMKDDPEYESWVIGHIKANLTFHNPWASFPGFNGNYFVDNFGSCIEEHHGVGMGKSNPAGKSMFDQGSKDSFWVRRAKKQEEYEELEKQYVEKREQNRALMEKAYAEKILARVAAAQYDDSMSRDQNDWMMSGISIPQIPAITIMPSVMATTLSKATTTKA